MQRRGATLLELIIAVCAIGVLLAILLQAVQRVRDAAVRVQSVNNLRQIAIATNQVAGHLDGFVGGYEKPTLSTSKEFGDSIARIPLQCNPQLLLIRVIDGESLIGSQETVGLRRYLVSPGDPSPDLAITTRAEGMVNYNTAYGGPASYAFNSVGFSGPIRFPSGLVDGTSNTIAFVECYCERYGWPLARPGSTSYLARSSLQYGKIDPAHANTAGQLERMGPRRPSFADAGWGDVLPVTDPVTHVTRPSVPGKTFEVRPARADARLPQTPFAAGLPVALFDGSVRTVRPGVAPEVFWAAVTPAGGEVASLD